MFLVEAVRFVFHGDVAHAFNSMGWTNKADVLLNLFWIAMAMVLLASNKRPLMKVLYITVSILFVVEGFVDLYWSYRQLLGYTDWNEWVGIVSIYSLIAVPFLLIQESRLFLKFARGKSA